ITEYWGRLARSRACKAGIDLRLVKPVCMDELQRILTLLQTLSMPGAHRITPRPTQALFRSVGRLQRLSDEIRIGRCSRRMLAKARHGAELARQTEKLLLRLRVQLNASRVHCQRVFTFLSQAS